MKWSKNYSDIESNMIVKFLLVNIIIAQVLFIYLFNSWIYLYQVTRYFREANVSMYSHVNNV